MVRRFVCLGLAMALWAQPCLASPVGAEASVTTTPEALAPLPGAPAPIPKVPNRPMEDFVAVTLISLPFTAFWGLIGALAIGGIAQNRFPPEFDTPLLTGAATFAAGSALTVGLVSVQWGGGKPAPLTHTAETAPQP